MACAGLLVGRTGLSSEGGTAVAELAVVTPFTGFSQFSEFMDRSCGKLVAVSISRSLCHFLLQRLPVSLQSTLCFSSLSISPKPKVSSVVTSMGVISRLQSRSWEGSALGRSSRGPELSAEALGESQPVGMSLEGRSLEYTAGSTRATEQEYPQDTGPVCERGKDLHVAFLLGWDIILSQNV